MAYTGGWTVCAAATAGGFAFFLIADHTGDDQRDNGDKHRADDNRRDIFRNPRKHYDPSPFILADRLRFCKPFCVFIRAEDQIEHHNQNRKGGNQADDMQVAGKGRTDLIDHQ